MRLATIIHSDCTVKDTLKKGNHFINLELREGGRRKYNIVFTQRGITLYDLVGDKVIFKQAH